MFDLVADTNADANIQWQSDAALPLQIVQRKQNVYAGLQLFDGLPVLWGITVPASMKPSLVVDVCDEHPLQPGKAFPGGPVFDAVEIELPTISHDWIWFNAKRQ